MKLNDFFTMLRYIISLQLNVKPRRYHGIELDPGRNKSKKTNSISETRGSLHIQILEHISYIRHIKLNIKKNLKSIINILIRIGKF